MIGFEREGTPASRQQIGELERVLGHELPRDFEEFLLRRDGGRPAPNEFSVGKQGNSSSVVSFLNSEQIGARYRRMASRLGPGVIPIADAEGGNLVCLEAAPQGWQVAFWDHETESLSELARSFDGFVECLQPFDPGSVTLEPGQVKKAWINPEFLKKHGGR